MVRGSKTKIKRLKSELSGFAREIDKFKLEPEILDEGKIIELSDGVAWVDGLRDVIYGEMVFIKKDINGLVFNLEESRVGIIILGNFEELKKGDRVISTGQVFRIGIGNDILGRVINPVGFPLDGKGQIKTETFVPVEKIAPGVVMRQPVNTPLQTGIKAIDSMIPIGRGQRELIIGDRGTGKTALAIDTIINQKNSGVISIYVAIGQKRSKIAQVVEKLKDFGVLENSVIVVASASEGAAFRYLAPYVGCSIGEYFMNKGKDVLVVFDDLTKHAWAYREISLLLRRPSGREAYPGDVFYLHSRLLERACKLSKENGGGSLTALPIIETQAGDVSAYIPTNVISITDGQIYLESDLFFSGIRPALNVGLSVSRVGGAAQIKAMKKVAGRLRLDLSQYWELATFAQFATDLDPATKEKIERGKRIIEVLKQPQYQPMKVEEQVVVINSAVSGILDDIPIKDIGNFEIEYLEYMREKNPKLLKELTTTKEISSDLEKKLFVITNEFKKSFQRKYLIKEENGQSQVN